MDTNDLLLVLIFIHLIEHLQKMFKNFREKGGKPWLN